MGISMRSPAAADTSRPRARSRARAAGLAGLAGVVAALGGAGSAQADTWGYEHVTPPGNAVYTPNAVAVSADASTALVASFQMPMDGFQGDGRPGPYLYALSGPAWGSVFEVPVIPSGEAHNLLSLDGRIISADGSRIMVYSAKELVPGGEGWYLWKAADPSGLEAAPLGRSDTHVTSPDLDVRVVLRGGTIRHWSEASGIQDVSVDNNGAPMAASGIGGGDSQRELLTTNALSEDGTKVMFSSSTALDGDTDTAIDIYQRDLEAGTTTLISDGTPGADADPNAAAQYRWASADHGLVLWRTTEQLTADDTDNAADLYIRDGATIERVSLGETVDGVPTGNADTPTGNVEWVASSEDGDRVFFITQERLTQDAPAAGDKLYEHDRSEGRTRFVAGPLAPADLAAGTGSNQARGSLLTTRATNASFRGVRVTPQGVVFQSAAPLAGDSGSEVDVFAWSRDRGLEHVSKPQAGAPTSASASASLLALGDDSTLKQGGRSVSDDGSRVFFTTAESLTPDDTDGGYQDVYVWSRDDGTLELVSPPGDAASHATYVDSSADGSLVYLHTSESILPGDVDGGDVDLYAAVHGGGSAPSAPVEPVPAGPGGPAGALPEVPSLPVPASGSPKAPEPGSGPGPVGPSEPDDGARPGRASLSVRAAKRVDDGKAVLVARASVDGELRVRGVSRMRRGGERRYVRVVSETADVAAGERTRVSLSLSNAALQRLERRGRLRVRFVVRLRPSGEERPARERVTVVLRSTGRR